ncbi:GNAT family N-acetyltransferase [Halobellus sp. Atlit-31R]|nr:GNAT family N-acetyltransferase [Halobellus sp. Atlit-31R]
MCGPDGSNDAGSDSDDRPSAVAIERPSVAIVDAVVDLWVALAAGQRAYDSHILPEANRDVVRETLAQRAVTGELRVAMAGGDVVGFVTFGLERGSYEQDATRGVVRNLYVRPAHRGHGVGSDLLAAAEAALEDAGATVVALEAMAGNDRAREFYRERGYTAHRVQFEKSTGVASRGATKQGSGTRPPDENDTHSKED